MAPGRVSTGCCSTRIRKLGIESSASRPRSTPASKSRSARPSRIDAQQRVDVRVGHRPAVGAAGERREDLACARVLGPGGRAGRPAGEDPFPARRLARHRSVKGAGDIQHVDARQFIRHVRRRRRVGEASRHEPRARLDMHPDLQLGIGPHPVLMQDLTLGIVLRHRDQHPGVGSAVPAADVELADQLVGRSGFPSDARLRRCRRSSRSFHSASAGSRSRTRRRVGSGDARRRRRASRTACRHPGECHAVRTPRRRRASSAGCRDCRPRPG